MESKGEHSKQHIDILWINSPKSSFKIKMQRTITWCIQSKLENYEEKSYMPLWRSRIRGQFSR